MKCKFTEAWVGRCKKNSDESKYCEKHKDIKCVSCGKQATHACHETMGLVCGSPICDDCEHTIYENGCNSGAPLPKNHKSHCKKTEQVYKPWYIEEYIKEYGIEAYNKTLFKHSEKIINEIKR